MMKCPCRALSIVACIFFCSFPLSAQQSIRLTANFVDVPLQEALRQIETGYPVSFSYDDQLLEGLVVSVRLDQTPLQEALVRLLAGSGLLFEVLDDRYVLIKKGEPFQEHLPPPLPSFRICGFVTDSESGEPLPGATAYVPHSPHGTTANNRGFFELNGAFRDRDSLTISFLGYNPVTVPVRELLDRPCQPFRLVLSTLWIPELTVREFSMDMIRVGEEGDILFKKERIPTLPGWGEPDVMRMLQLLPGIGSADESAARMNVRGGTPDQNLVLWEGIPLYHTGHFFGMYDAFNPYIVDQVNVWRGNFGVEYGGRNASVIDVRGKPGYATEKTWGVGFNLLSLQAFMEKPLFQKEKSKKKNPDKKGSMLIAMRRSWVDLINSSTYENLFDQVFQNGRIDIQEQGRSQNDRISWDPLIEYGDFNFTMRWSRKPNRHNSFTLFSTRDKLDYRFSYEDSLGTVGTRDLIEATNLGWSWQQRAEWSKNFRIHYKVAGSGYSNDYAFRWTQQGQQEADRQYSTHNIMGDLSAQFHHSWDVTDKHQMSFGYQLSSQAAEFAYRDTNFISRQGEVLESDTITHSVHTFYASFDYNIHEKFLFSLGIRENHSPARGLYYSEPRISFVWRTLWDGFSINGSMGRYWQFVFQVVNFTDLGVGEPLWGLTNEDIPAQELWQWTLGMRFERPSLLIDAEIYRKDARNLTTLNLRVDSDFDRPLSFNGRSHASGLDVLVRKRIPPYSIWASWSASEVDLEYPELNNGVPFPARHDIRQRLNLVNMLSWKHWDLAFNLHIRSGSPYSIPDVVEKPCTDCTGNQYVLQYTQLHNARLPNVVRLDASATFKFGKGNKKGKAGLAVYNLMDRRNILDVDYVLETPSFGLPSARRLNRMAAGLSPNLFVQYEW